MIELRATPDGVLLPVHAQPGARRERIVGEHGGRLGIAGSPRVDVVEAIRTHIVGIDQSLIINSYGCLLLRACTTQFHAASPSSASA